MDLLTSTILCKWVQVSSFIVLLLKNQNKKIVIVLNLILSLFPSKLLFYSFMLFVLKVSLLYNI